MSDERPGNPVNARVARQRSFRKLGELAIIAPGEIVADFANLLIDDMIIVDQPFSRGRDELFFADRCGDCAITTEQYPGVISETRRQWQTCRRLRRDALSQCKALRVLLEPFDAEEFAPNRPMTNPGDNSPGPPEAPKYGMFH
jgi:hypothetical protein